MGCSYSDAIAALNTLQSNSQIVDAIRKSGQGMNKNAIPEMIEWVRRMGYEPADFNKIKPIHIAGTKGKGSTSAFISSILAQYLPSSSRQGSLFDKIGLYTSPHLRFVRERIQINNEPLSEEAFARYFFETWDRLEGAARTKGEPTDKTAKPVYFRFLTLMAFHTYMQEGVDMAVIECGIGGEYDSTNVLVRPTVTGITSLGIDHTAVLGNTIEKIAWHKAGIMKPNIPAFTAPQPTVALKVLQQRAKEINAPLTVVSNHPALEHIQLGLLADFQHINASLAIAITASHLATTLTANSAPAPFLPTADSLPPEFTRGLEQVRWPGRCEVRRERNIAWHIDSGHTLESIRVAASWFASQIPPPSSSHPPTPISKHTPRPRILLFNQQTRDANALALALHSTLSTALHAEQRPFTHAVFCTNITSQKEGYRPDLASMNTDAKIVEGLEVQKMLAETWRGVDPGTEVVVRGSIEEGVGGCRGVAGAVGERDEGEEGGEEVMVLVTGSVHLVGGFLEGLETGEELEKGSG